MKAGYHHPPAARAWTVLELGPKIKDKDEDKEGCEYEYTSEVK
jgi:hypothetical protein